MAKRMFSVDKDSTPAQALFDAVLSQRLHTLRYRGMAKRSEDYPFRDLHVQLAWNNRVAARWWANELEMTRDAHEEREVKHAVARLAHEVTHWRDDCKMTHSQIVERVRNWGDRGDWGFAPCIRIKAAQVMMDILF